MNLHPTIAQALRPWMPPTAPMPLPTLAELDEQRERMRLREKLHDEYRTGLDSVDDEPTDK